MAASLEQSDGSPEILGKQFSVYERVLVNHVNHRPAGHEHDFGRTEGGWKTGNFYVDPGQILEVGKIDAPYDNQSAAYTLRVSRAGENPSDVGRSFRITNKSAERLFSKVEKRTSAPMSDQRRAEILDPSADVVLRKNDDVRKVILGAIGKRDEDKS